MAQQRLTGPRAEKDSAASKKDAWSTAHRTRAPGAALRELEERGNFVTAGTPLQTFTKLDVIIAKMRVAAAHRKGLEVANKQQPLGTSKSFNSRRHSQTRKKKQLPWIAPRLYRFFDDSVQVGCKDLTDCSLYAAAAMSLSITSSYSISKYGRLSLYDSTTNIVHISCRLYRGCTGYRGWVEYL